ncbi:MAG: hypothetical protein K6A34_03875 [Methanobrevibacter sp.]|nr:hypothetical protein [Methanobrevibacter sp.]
MTTKLENIKNTLKSKIKNKKSKSDNIKFLNEIKVAVISDQFTHDSFKYEFELIEISPDNWLEKFEKEKPDLFFCESTWHGYFNGENGVWSNKIVKYAEAEDDREILFEILDYCKKNDIPTIFWNKEDPVYYRKTGEFFSDTARRFDYIFTSAEEVIDNYKKDFNHENVFPLMFAGQPKLFNPLKLDDEETSDVVFAGSYYKHHENRAKNMDLIFDKILSQNVNLRIYDRTYYDNIPHIGYPEKYKKYTNPPIDYKDTAKVYKTLKWAININTITESNTMFARRVFELALSNTNIISNYSKAMKRLFGDNIFIIEEDDFPQLNEDYEDKRLKNLYNVLSNHTYTERWKYILDTINFPYKEKTDDVSIVFNLNNMGENESIEKFEEIDYDYKKLILISDNEITLEKSNVFVYDSIPEFLENISTEYYIIANDELDNTFIKKAILHYKYLSKNNGIKQNKNEFKINMSKDYINVLFNKKINNLNKEYFDVYYI